MASQYVDFVNKEFKNYGQSFVLNPAQMKGFTTRCKLDWKKVAFNKINKSLIPQERGVYAFIVEYNIIGVPPHGYIMYIGETGQDSLHNLQKRYADYLKDKQKPLKRLSLHYMLNNWEECLHFHYAVVKDKRVNLKKLEKNLNDAFIPPYNINDFSAEIRKGKQAWPS